MKKPVLYAMAIAAVLIVIAAIIYFANPTTPSIQSDVFYINKWNNTEYVEKWTQDIQGTVIKAMPAKEKNQFSCIIEVKKEAEGINYICYFVDKVEHPVGEVTDTLTCVNIGSYNYEENIVNVRQIPVFLSMDVVKDKLMKE